MIVADLETPYLTIDLDRVARNIGRAQDYCNRHGYSFRPHRKTHKNPDIARMQLDAGAVGITCQKIGEAEIMADAGVTDILLTYPVIGEQKAHRLAELATKCNLAVAADSTAALGWVARAAQESGREIDFLVECDTGGDRLGVQTPPAELALAREAANATGRRF